MIENRFFILVHHTAHTGGGGNKEKTKAIKRGRRILFYKIYKKHSLMNLILTIILLFILPKYMHFRLSTIDIKHST